MQFDPILRALRRCIQCGLFFRYLNAQTIVPSLAFFDGNKCQVAWVLLNGWLYAWELEAEFLVWPFGQKRLVSWFDWAGISSVHIIEEEQDILRCFLFNAGVHQEVYIFTRGSLATCTFPLALWWGSILKKSPWNLLILGG